MGYLLENRVGRIGEFLDALERVAAELLVGRRDSPLDTLAPREREVLELMRRATTTR